MQAWPRVLGPKADQGGGSAVAHFGQLFLEGLTFLWGVLALPTGVFRLTAESAYYQQKVTNARHFRI